MSKRLVISFCVIAALFTAATSILHSTSFHRHLLSVGQKGIGISIDFRNSEIKILRGILILEGLKAGDPAGRFRLAADRVLVDLSPLSLIRGKFIVTDLEIDRPSLVMTGISAGPKPDIFRRFFNIFEGSFLLQNLILDRIAIHDFSLEGAGDRTWALKNAVLRLGPTLFREIEIDAKIEDATGILSPLKSLDLELTLKKDGGRLKELKVGLPKAELSFKGGWKGDWEKGSLKVEGGLTAPSVLSDTLLFSTEAMLDRKTASFKKIEAHLGGATLEGEGSLDIEKLLYQISFKAKDFALESVFQKMPSVVLGPAKGIAEVSGEAHGVLPQIRVEARAEIRDFRHGLLAANHAHGTVSLNWPQLDFDALVSPGVDGRDEGQVKGGVLFKHLPGFEKLQAVTKGIDLRFQNAPLADILPTVKVSGNLSGDLHLEGAQGTSVQGTGQAKVTEGNWALGPVSLLNTRVTIRPGGKVGFSNTEFEIPNFVPVEWPGSINMETPEGEVLFSGEPVEGLSVKGRYEKESGLFRIDSLRVRRDESALDGTMSLAAGGKIEALLKGTSNLKWLFFLPAFFREGEGLTKVDLAASGSIKDPALRGEIEFLGNTITLRAPPGELSDLKGTLRIEGSTLKPHLSGKMGDGEFQMEGELKLLHWKPQEADLSLRGKNLTVARPNVYRVDFDADLSLKGVFPAPRLEGRIDIVDGRYVKPFVVHELVLKPSGESNEEPSWEKSLEAVPIRLAVKNSGDLKIENNVASLLMQSDLQLQGTYGRPRILGTVTATEGTFYYLGHDFALREARLEFLDPYRREPYLLLTAQQEIPPDYTVSVELKGYLSNLEITLLSSPLLPKEDIVSLLAFGLTSEEMRASGRSRLSLAADVAAGEVTGLLERPISKTTGLDRFRLEASESGRLSRVSVGKNLTDRFSLGYTQDFAPKTAERTLEANYYLTDNILLKGFRTREAGTTPRYQFNVSFRFRLY